MDLIPLIVVKNRKVSKQDSDLLDKITNGDEQIIYLLDIDGIERNKPNLCTYQRLSKNFQIWVDGSPRNIGDVVDAFMAGAESITLRTETWPSINIENIREISDNKVFINIEKEGVGFLPSYNADGLVNFNTKEEVEGDFKTNHMLKQLSSKNNLFSYEDNPKNLTYWKTYNPKGLLVDIKKIEEFKKYGI